MNDWRDEPINRHDTVTIRIIWVAFALSLFVHIAALWTAPPLMRPLAFEPSDKAEPTTALIAQLAPRASAPESTPPPPAPPSRAAPPPARRAPPPARPVPRPSPPSIARSETIPGEGPTPPPRPPPSAEVQPPGPPAETDLSAYIASRRNARGEPAAPSDSNAPPAESDKDRLNRIVTANLGLNKTPTFGDDPKRGGGMFQIRRIGYDDAEFFFNGWDQDIGRIARQLIEVRKGANPDIRIAVVRKIIEIIRAHEPGDFIWVSHRMNRQVALSARPADNAALEDYMMREFFGDGRSP